jgi:hypothetical protein
LGIALIISGSILYVYSKSKPENQQGEGYLPLETLDKDLEEGINADLEPRTRD